MDKISASEEALRQQFKERKYMTRADQRKWITKKGKINLTGEQMAVLREFVSCNSTIGVAAAVANAEKDFPVNVATIAKRSGFSEQRVYRFIERLVALKLMTVTTREGKPSLYRLHLKPMLEWKKEKPQESPAVIAKRKNAAKAREARAKNRAEAEQAKEEDDLAAALRDGMEAAGLKMADRRLEVSEANLARTQEQLLDLQQNMALAERMAMHTPAKKPKPAPKPVPAKPKPAEDEGPVIEPWTPGPNDIREGRPYIPEVKIDIGFKSASDDPVPLEPEPEDK